MSKDKLSVEVNLKKIMLDLSKDAIVLDLDLKGFIGEKQVYHEKQRVKQFLHEDKKERIERSKIFNSKVEKHKLVGVETTEGNMWCEIHDKWEKIPKKGE